MKATDEIKLKAFLVAIDRLDSPLPENAYATINQAGVLIAQHNPDRAIELLENLAQSYPHLSDRYKAARLDLRHQYQAQERSKSAVLTLEKTGTDLEQDAILLLTRFNPQTFDLFSTSAQKTKQSTRLWEKVVRIAIMFTGGVALGNAIAQLPGALILGAIAVGYGLYISFVKQDSVRKA